MTNVSCNYTDHLGEQKGIILGQVKGSIRVYACWICFHFKHLMVSVYFSIVGVPISNLEAFAPFDKVWF